MASTDYFIVLKYDDAKGTISTFDTNVPGFDFNTTKNESLLEIDQRLVKDFNAHIKRNKLPDGKLDIDLDLDPRFLGRLTTNVEKKVKDRFLN